MSRVVLIHGAFNELWGPHEIAARWVPALRDGLWQVGADLDPADVSCVFYGDLFRLDPDAGEMPDPADLATKSGLLDVIGSLGDTGSIDVLANAVGEAAHQRLLDQMGRFLAAGDIRRGVRHRVDMELGPETELVIAHSLGTVIAYLVLADRPELTPALITMGSPLGNPMLKGQLSVGDAGDDGGPSPWPGGVRSWTNIVAVGDPACGPSKADHPRGLAHHFGDDVTDHQVDNGHRAHDPEPYLNAAVTGRAVASALGLATSR